MKKLFLLAVIFNFTINLVASENEFVLRANIEGVSPTLRYFVPDYESDFKCFGVKAELKDPFLYVFFYPENYQHLDYNKDWGFVARNPLNADAHRIADTCNILKKCIPQLPLHYFLTTDDSKKLKKKGDELFSFSKNFGDKELKFIIKLNSDIQLAYEELIQRFREFPQIWPSKDEDEKRGILIKNEILAIIDGKKVHGINSIFGDAVIKKEREKLERERLELEIRAEQAKYALYSSRRTSCLKVAGISLALLIVYVLYYKFYTTN